MSDYHGKNLFTKSSDSETSTKEMDLKENSTDSKRSKIHNGEQGSVTVSLFKLLFMRTDVRLQVFLHIRKNNRYMYTWRPKKVQISSQNQVQLNEQKTCRNCFSYNVLLRAS